MRTVIGLYDRFEDANAVIRALQDEGFARDDISLVARDATGEYSQYFQDHDIRMNAEGEATSGAAAGAGVGAVLGGLGGLLLGLGALAIPGVGPVLAAGPLMSALAGAGIGAVAGGLLGALVDLGVPEEHAQLYAEGVRRGGSLVVVRAADDHVEHARDILNRFNPIDIEERGATWRGSQWSGFNENAEPLSADELEFNRTDMYDRRSVMPVTGSGVTGSTITGGMAGTMDTMETDLHDGTRKLGNDVEQNIEGMRDNLKDVRRDVDYNIDRSMERTGDNIGDFGHDVERGVDRAGDKLRDIGHDVARGVDNVGDNVREGFRDMGSTLDHEFDRYDMDYRNHYATTFGSMGRSYDYYMPAYRYGYQLARDERYRGYDWNRLEMDARRDWESQHRDTLWDDVKDAVRHAWHSITR